MRDYSKIAHLLPSLGRYVNDRIAPGGFLRAVLQNDLYGAVARADPQNRALLPEIVEFVHWELPEACHGSREDVSHWLAGKKGL